VSTTVDPRANTGQGSSSSGGSSATPIWTFANNPVAKTANYTMTAQDGTIKVDATGAQRTVFLPDASTVYANGMGQVFTVKKIDSSANNVIIQATTGQMIDGFNNVIISQQWDSITIQSSGMGWDILSTI